MKQVRFLIIRFSSIGDIVLTTPVVRCLKLQYPNAEIHYLTKPVFVPLLEHNPYITKVHTLGSSIAQTALTLKSLQFDYIIDLHQNLRSRIVKAIIDVPAFSFEKLNLEKSLMVSAKIQALPAIHIVDRYLDTVSAFGIRNDFEGLDYFFPQHLALPDSLPPSFIAIAIGAQHATKRLPTHQLIKLCTQITSPVVLLGGKEDAATGESIALASGKHVINLCGKLSLHQSAKAVQQANCLITHDTGLMHIAAALKKPVVSVWGNTIPAFGMTAYYGKHNVMNSLFEVKGLSCRPCSKIGYSACPKKHFHCMELQDTKAIATTAEKSHG